MSRPAGRTGAVAVVSAVSAASVLLGLGRDVVVSAVFGASSELDAYLVAQGLMNLVLALVAGALASAVVPVVSAPAAAGDPAPAHRGVATALTVAVGVLGVAAVVAGLLAGDVVAALAPGFDPEAAALARRLTRIVLIATVLIAATNVLAAVAQSHHRFFWAAAQGVPFNLVMIVAAAGFGPRYGVAALAVGYVTGSAARLLLQLIPLRGLAVRLVPRLDLRDPAFRAIVRLLPPLLLVNVVGSVGTMIDRAVASTRGEGTITTLSYAWRVVSLADMVVVASYVAVLYPAFGVAAAAPGRAELRRLAARGLTGVTLVIVPAVAGLVAAAAPVTALVYGRGNFDGRAVALTTTAVAWYAPGLLPLAWREVATRALYAVGDGRTPGQVAVLALAVKAAGDLTLGLTYGVPGIAASTVGSVTLAAVLTTAQLARRHGGVDGRALVRPVVRLGLAGLAAGIAGAALLAAAGSVAGEAASTAGWDALARCAAAGVVVAGTYVLALLLLRAPELRMLDDGIRALARRRRRPAVPRVAPAARDGGGGDR
ncbi:MAG TPA: murein biosynthesis integral membrane protein MurJ [Mycobacteriales bacterium]